MTKHSNSRRVLTTARFFAGQAESTDINDREALINYLEAAIVFGRSVTWHLQAEYKHRGGFDIWYGAHQKAMGDDPICKFFLESRNLILKKGPVEVHKIVSVSMQMTATFSGFCEARVIRGKPLYRRSAKIIWEDLRSGIMQPIRKWRWRREIAGRRAQAQRETRGHVTEGLYFDDPAFIHEPALALLGKYLDKLEAIVDDAEAQWPHKNQSL